MAWNTNQATFEGVNLTKPYLEFTTNVSVLLDKDADTGITMKFLHFWCVLCHFLFIVLGATRRPNVRTTHATTHKQTTATWQVLWGEANTRMLQGSFFLHDERSNAQPENGVFAGRQDMDLRERLLRYEGMAVCWETTHLW